MYEQGLPPETREFIMLDRRDPASEPLVRQLMTLHGTKHQYEAGAHQDLVSPDGWTLDQHFLDLPGRLDAQLDLAFDYPSNLARYPAWQEWLRRIIPRLWCCGVSRTRSSLRPERTHSPRTYRTLKCGSSTAGTSSSKTT